MENRETFYVMPSSEGVYLLNAFDCSDILKERVRRGWFFDHRELYDLRDNLVVSIYYDWVLGPWYHLRIFREGVVFARFNPVFSRRIFARYGKLDRKAVKYHIIKKNYGKGQFSLANEFGECVFEFLQHGFLRSSPFEKALFVGKFRYRSEAEKNFFLGLLLCIPEAMTFIDPPLGN